MKKKSSLLLLAFLMVVLASAGCRKSASVEAVAQDEHNHEKEAAPDRLTLSPEAVAAGGFVIEQAGPAKVQESVQTLGEMEINPRRIVHLTARAAGRVETTTAVAGDRTAAGRILAEIYSPDFLAAQAEFLQAEGQVCRLAGGSEESSARAFLEAGRTKLRPFGLEEADFEALISSRILRPFLPVRAPFAGTVLEAPAVAGDHVDLGTPLFTLADLSTLWACVHIYERDLASIRPGVPVTIRAQAWPGEEFRGRLVLVGESVDPNNRTIDGRVEVPNPSGKLKTGMFIEAAIETGGTAMFLAVSEAALHTIRGKPRVFVPEGPGTYAVREVETGLRINGRVEILRGLEAGESVVTKGGILLKSEFLKATMKDEHGHG